MFKKYITAFSKEKNSGNPAAVYVVDEFPESLVMQNIATRENLSETAFVRKTEASRYDIRWFTPVSEAPICVHATLAAAYVLYNFNFIDCGAKIVFINKCTELSVWQERDWISVVMPRSKVVRLEEKKDKDVLKLLKKILHTTEYTYTGKSSNILFVEMKFERELKNFTADLSLIKQLPYRALLITAASKSYDFVSRYFAPNVGIDEDPVCGSAHCRLIPYWADKLKKDEMIAYQASKRGGVIKCKNKENEVVISGQATIIF